MAGGAKINDTKPARAESDVPSVPRAGIVRAAVDELTGHALQPLFGVIAMTDESTNPAHDYFTAFNTHSSPESGRTQ
jgi:hypothetical protein